MSHRLLDPAKRRPPAWQSYDSLVLDFTTLCRLATQIDGREAGTVRSKALCDSVQTIYMGPDPVAPDAKASFAEGIARMLED